MAGTGRASVRLLSPHPSPFPLAFPLFSRRLTKRAVLEVMRGTFELQAEKMLGMVEKAANDGRVTDMRSLQAFISRPSFGQQLQAEVERYTLEQTGVAVREIDAITNAPEYQGDAAFVDALTRVATQGQQVLQQAQSQVAQMVGGGGGMDGMMGGGFGM